MKREDVLRVVLVFPNLEDTSSNSQRESRNPSQEWDFYTPALAVGFTKLLEATLRDVLQPDRYDVQNRCEI